MPSSDAYLDTLAECLVGDHEHLIGSLHMARTARHLSVETVAERMGVTPDTVRVFERYDSNPRLDTVRRYAMAVEARIHTDVILDEEQ